MMSITVVTKSLQESKISIFFCQKNKIICLGEKTQCKTNLPHFIIVEPCFQPPIVTCILFIHLCPNHIHSIYCPSLASLLAQVGHPHSVLSSSLHPSPWFVNMLLPIFHPAFPKPCPTNHVVPLASLLYLACIVGHFIILVPCLNPPPFFFPFGGRVSGTQLATLTNNFANNN